MRIVKAQTMTELWHSVNRQILLAQRKDLDYVSSLDVMQTDCVGHARSAEFDFNIGRDLWLTPMRWTTLVRQYIDWDALQVWLDGCERIGIKGRGINAMDMKGVNSTVVAASARASRRKWGGCMRMVTFRAFPQPTISLFSRTSYLGYIGGLDMLVAHKLAAAVGERIGVGVEDFAFTWHCDAWQFHGFKSMAYVIGAGYGPLLVVKGKKAEAIDAKFPTLKLVRGWFKRITDKDERGETYGEMKYSAERRIRRRYHATIGESRFGDEGNKAAQPLDVPTSSLSLEKARR